MAYRIEIAQSVRAPIEALTAGQREVLPEADTPRAPPLK